jgi:hypothetical protein
MIYEKRLVLFADVLGWSIASENEEIQILHSAISELHSPAAYHNEAYRARLLEEEVNGGIRVNPMFLDVQFAVFSDNFVFSVPASFGARILTVSAQLVLDLLRRGFLVRGGIAFGDLYHRDNVIFGPALNEAVSIEKSKAIFPRILLSDAAKTHIRSLQTDPQDSSMLLDQKGEPVANPFAVGFGGPQGVVVSALQENFRPREIDEVIDREIARLRGQGDQTKADKWIYMREFIDGPALAASPHLGMAWGMD